MVTKGIVEDITNPYKVKVRLPVYDAVEGSRDATAIKDLSYATICTLPNTANNVEKGDVVFVSFEDNDLSKPVIIGHLFRDTELSTRNDLDIRMLITNSTTKLYKETYIGDVKPSELQMLIGLKANIQLQIDNLQEQINRLNGGTE